MSLPEALIKFQGHALKSKGDALRTTLAAPQSKRLKDIYDSFFDVRLAQSGEEIQSAFRLRFQVYCVETRFEDPADNPGRMERDGYDAHALHSLLYHRATQQLAGTVRLILPKQTEGTLNFPICSVCSHELFHYNTPVLPWERTAEISRFAVSKDFRRRVNDRPPAGSLMEAPSSDRRVIMNSSLGLMQAIVTMAKSANITHICAVMEPFLLRMLSRLGIHFAPLGPLVEYHGLRQPCYADLDALLARTWSERVDVWEILTNDGHTWPLNADLMASRSI